MKGDTEGQGNNLTAAETVEIRVPWAGQSYSCPMLHLYLGEVCLQENHKGLSLL